MSILIKGMEMPDRCFACPMCDTDCCSVSKGSYIEYRDVDVDVAMDGRPDWCPLVPVPEHGDLIDRDETAKTLAHDYAYAAADMVRNEIPTIIPADKEGEG